MQIQLKSRGETYTFEARSGEPILFAGVRQSFELPYGCASGTCGTCRVKRLSGTIQNGWVDAPGMKGVDPDTREFLMCQCAALDDVVAETRSPVHRAQPDDCRAGYFAGLLRAGPQIARDIMEFSIALESEMSFEAGQFVAIQAPGLQGRRVYSMTNFEHRARRLDFVVKRKPGGAFTERLFGGGFDATPVEVFGPLGRAIFTPSTERHLLVIAGGSGIAGMMSILSRAVEERHFDRYSGNVFFGVRTWADVFYLDTLSRIADRAGERIRITVAFSDEDVPPSAAARYPAISFARGFVHEVAAGAMSAGYSNTRAFVAGPPPAVDASLRYLLRQAKLSPGEIRFDKFE